MPSLDYSGYDEIKYTSSDMDSQALEEFDYSQSGRDYNGNANSYPLTSDTPQQAGQKGDAFEEIGGWLKKFGSVATQITQTSRQLGQAVGAIEQSTNNAQTNFESGRKDARRVTRLENWWQTSPVTDKILLGIAIAGLYVAVIKK